MECKYISVDEFRFEKVPSKYHGITNQLHLHVLQFFENHPQDCLYVVTGTTRELYEAFNSAYTFYSRFGVYVQYGEGSTPTISSDKEYIWYVGDEVSLRCVNGVRPTVCAIKSAGEDELADKLSKVTEIDAAVNVWNLVQRVGRVPRRREAPGFACMDVLPLLRECNIQCVENSTNVKALYNLYLKLQNLGNSNTLLLLNGGDKNERLMWSYFATVLSLQGRKVDVSRDNISVFLSLQRKVFSQQYLFTEDYLQKLANPVNVAVCMRGAVAFLCIRNTQKCPSVNDVAIQVYATPFSFATHKIKSKRIQRYLCAYADLKIKPVDELFSIAGEFTVSKEKSFELDALLQEFNEILVAEAGGVGDPPLNLSNVFFFTSEGAEYVGYVSRIETNFHYQFLPLSKKYESFSRDVSLQEYDRFLDISVFTDYERLLEKLGEFVGKDRHHFELPRGLKGMLLRALPARTSLYQEDCGFSFEEIGIWSAQTSQCRLGTEALLLKYFKEEVLRQKKFLTFWGGNHPAVTNSLVVDYSIWG